jgi:hypothetical protein
MYCARCHGVGDFMRLVGVRRGREVRLCARCAREWGSISAELLRVFLDKDSWEEFNTDCDKCISVGRG